ncbi:MAG: cation transporter [Planctomycetes bacterium]|nr:cation transporter [Planctomycetota bacterium]MBL7008250.1 cation transporter [Planctomycetota bacterium]
MSDSSSQKSITATGTVKVATGLLLAKVVTWLVTGSSGILGSTLDSALDLIASTLVLWAVLHAERPADADHAWGHGKAEGLAALFQSLLIFASGAGLAVQVVRRLLAEETTVENHWIGIVVMLLSTAVTLWWVRQLKRAARETGSPALEADSAHYTSDVLLNLSVVAGLALSTLFDGEAWPDLVVGLGIALIILNSARQVFLSGVQNLMDRGLDPSEEAAILRVISGYAPRVRGFHELRTRRSGAETFLELHLDLDSHLSFIEAHDLSEDVGLAIEQAVPRSRATVHADPI